MISESKVGAIIGNPPWLTYNQSADIIRNELRTMSETRYQIWPGGNNSANQDVAALFYCRAAELYLTPKGKIGMVMPHSVLRSGQHLKFRNAYYETKRPPRSREAIQAMSLDFSAKAPWDLSELEPNNFFPITSCVVFARLNGGWGDQQMHQQAARPLAPGPVEIWRGTTTTPYVPLRLRPSQVHVIGATGTADATRADVPLIHDGGTFRSPYEGFARRGADVFDRRIYFVEAYPNENRFAPPDTFVTYPREGSQDQKKYSVETLSGQIVSGDNLFDVYLGESLAPYVALPPLTAALPVSKETMVMPLDHSACKVLDNGLMRHDACEVDKQELTDNMRARWEKMEPLWDANKGKSDTKSLTQNLNWLNKLTSQLEYLRDPGDRPVRIAYTTSGRPTAALIAKNKAIVDTTLYQVSCASTDEAYYLLAIINSLTLEAAVSDFRPTGLYGARHVHKHPWKLPIPEYDGGDDRHVRLSMLGREAAEECRALLDELIALNKEGWLTAERARSNLRNGWQPGSERAQAIEGEVRALLAAG